MRDIDCPDGCSYLVTGRSNAHDKAIERLVEFSRERDEFTGEAVDAFLGEDRGIEEWLVTSVMGYIGYGHVDRSGERLVDIFLRERGAELAAEQREVLEAYRRAAFSMYEVQDVRIDEGVELLDLLSGERLFVSEKLGTRQLVRYDLMLAWIYWLGGRCLLGGALSHVPRRFRDPVLEALREASKGKGAGPRRLAALALAGHRRLRHELDIEPLPEIRNTDGEDLVVSKALYECSDPSGVRDVLSSRPDFEDHGEGSFGWIDPDGNERMPGPLSLGSVVVEDNRLTLETNSRGRHERGMALLADALGPRIDHVESTHRSLEELYMEAEERGDPEPPPEDEIPLGIRQEITQKFMQKYIRRWLDMSNPALDGNSPREAVRTKRGREKVLTLLHDFENTDARRPDGRLVDYSLAYLELGLERK